MDTRLVVIFALIILATSSCADHRKYAKLDTDGNGKITMDEARASNKLSAEWYKVDANQDGFVDSAEFSAYEVKP